MSDATLRGRLTAALDTDPHYSTSDVVATVMRVLGETGGDLRNRIADAIRRVVRISPGPNTLADLNAGRSIPISGGEADDAALAVMPVVQAALTEQTQRAEQAKRDLDGLYADLTDAERTIAGIRHACRVAVQPPENPRVVDFARRILADLDQPAASRTASDGLVQRLARAEAAVQRVRKVHRPGTDWSWRDFGCTHEGRHQQLCAACRTCYPCPTITALDQPEDS